MAALEELAADQFKYIKAFLIDRAVKVSVSVTGRVGQLCIKPVPPVRHLQAAKFTCTTWC